MVTQSTSGRRQLIDPSLHGRQDICPHGERPSAARPVSPSVSPPVEAPSMLLRGLGLEKGTMASTFSGSTKDTRGISLRPVLAADHDRCFVESRMRTGLVAIIL